jgi:predicted ribosome quality control (RQC) complex YloA/Tae2 family protein
VNELKNGKVYFYEPIKTPSIISLFELHHLQNNIAVTVNNNVNEVWKKLIYQNQYKTTLQKILNECRTKISDRIEYLEKTHQKIMNVNELEKKKKLSQLKGNLLLTFSSQIRKGTDQVQLRNIYSEYAEEVTIKLDPKLNAQQNANKYFQKYKNIDEKKVSLQIKKETILDELEHWKKIYENIEKIDNLKKAEKLKQSLVKDTLMQPEKATKKDTAPNIFSFNRLLLDQRWEVFIGKNAKNNDILTFKFANKNDLWFHAQGVPGSHVILRSRERGNNPPMNIVEQVASIAAYYSAAHNSSTVAVNYTEVRYVRKPRKSNPGTALLTQSKTIFVQPKKYL